MSTQVKHITDEPFDLENTEKPFGKRWGGETFVLTENDINELKKGKLIALDIMNEYVTYLKLES